MNRVKAAFQLRSGGKFAKGWVGSGNALTRSLKDWRPYAGAGIKLVTSTVTEGGGAYERLTSDDNSSGTRRKLDPNA